MQGFLSAYLWDRVADRAPIFDVAELHGAQLHRYRLQTGQLVAERLADVSVTDGVLLAEPGFCIRAVVLDHHTPVIAYKLEPDMTINIRKYRLAARDWAVGPWLNVLKQCLLTRHMDARIELPDGQSATASELGVELALIAPGKRLVYATDLTDSESNRRLLIDFARNAHTFFCESPFMRKDAEQARRTGHLTTAACGEIAAAAGVARLVPFHFSHRYAENTQALYDEIREVCDRVIVPPNTSMLD